jgi:hypothetical protein
MELKELEKELEIVGAFMANILIAEIYAKGKVASGNLVKSVEFEVVNKGNKYVVDLLADRYIINVSEGRKAGYPKSKENKGFVEALIKWVIIKGKASDSKSALGAALAIREAIFKRGIPPTNIIEFAIEEIDKQVDAMVREAIGKDIERHFDDMFQRLG